MTPADPLNLTHHDDDREEARSGPWRAFDASELAGGGGVQLALLGEPGAQRALDGRFELATPEGRSPEPILGTNAEFCTECKTEPPAAKVSPRQLVLDLTDTAAIPQLDLYERRDLQHAAMCAELGDAGFRHRLSKCGRTRVPRGRVTMFRDERASWHHSGYVKCGHWCCAKCGTSEARTTAATLGCGFTWWLQPRRNKEGGRRDRAARFRFRDVWMLTLTLPHKMADEPGATVEKLFDAHARFKRSAAWRAFCAEWGIRSAVRVLDPTFGGRDGVHPHFHIALFVERARDTRAAARLQAMELEPSLQASDGADLLGWVAHRSMTPQARKQRCAEIGVALWGAWHDALRAAGVEHMIGEQALQLSPGEKAAAYFTGWGLADEVGATTAKNRSHLRLLDAAGAGVDGAGAMFVAWVAATHGKQWVTGLADVRARLGITDDDIQAHADELRAARDAAALERNEVPYRVRPLVVDVPDALYDAALSLGWKALHAICNGADARDEDAQRALVDALCAERRRLELLRTRQRGARSSNDNTS